MSIEDLQRTKQELDRLRTNLSAAMMRRDEVMAGLQQNYGFDTAKAAEAEQKKLREKTIPTMEKKRDGFIAKAEDIINGLNTETGPGAAGAGQGRTVVGRKRGG
jgi:hypothetical protein